MLILAGLLTIVVLTVATGFFVAQEFAYVAVDRNRLRLMAEQGDPAARRALQVTERLSFMLSGAQLGITVTGLLVGYVAEPYLGQGLADLLGLAGIPRAASLSIAVVIALLFATVVQMVFGELAPKNLAIVRAESLAKALSRSTLVYLAVAGPVIRVFDAAANRLLRRVGVEPIEELPQGATPEDLELIVADSRAEGRLDEDTSQLLEQGLDFPDRTAGEVMVPRVDVVTVSGDAPAIRIVELLDTGHSRFPVIGDGVDDVRGVVSLAEVSALTPAQRRTTTAAAIAVAPLVVPKSLPVSAVLEWMRAEHRQLVCVIDEFGGFAGIVTLEDIAEELVGEIMDEDDHPEPDADHQADDSWLVPGRWRLDEVAAATGIELPHDSQYDTISGLILVRLGRLPETGDVVEVELVEAAPDPATDRPDRTALLTVVWVERHVPHTVRVALSESDTGVDT